MTSFHPFSRLPMDIRLLIWGLTVEPRIVDIHWHTRLRALSSSTPAPPQLQACREARNAGLYKRFFSDVTVLKGKRKNLHQRYIWLHLAVDTIFIHSHLKVLRPVAHMIKRLRFTANNSFDARWRSDEHGELRNFINVSEIHVVVSERDTFRDWHGASVNYDWPCGREDVLVIDPKVSQEIKLVDLECKFDQLAQEESEAEGSHYLYQNGQTTNDLWEK